MEFRIVPDKCVACHACVRVCPVDAVAVEGENVWIIDQACIRCGLCLPACPHEAIIAVGDLERAFTLESWLPSETVQKLIGQMKKLPSPPTLSFKIVAEL